MLAILFLPNVTKKTGSKKELLKTVKRFMNLRNVRLSSVAFVAVVAFTASASMAAGQSQSALKKEAKVTEAQAAKSALAKVPDGTIKSSELENENGKLIWSFDIAKPKTRNIIEIQVDAKTGKLVSTQTESPADQLREAKTEKTSKNQ
jgi:uncharacterized membrane protein YkoI